MPWWVTALIYIGFEILYQLIAPKPQFDSPEPSSLGDFQFPTIGEGRVIPILWGTCKIAGPMVAWYGDLEVQAIKKWVQTGWWGIEGKHITTHYRYWLGMQLVFCSGEIDEVLEVRFDDRVCDDVTFTPQTDRTRVNIDEMTFFGGDEEEGGIFGSIYVYHGNASQEPDSYLQSHLGTDIPAWRHICYAVFDHVYLGTSAYLKEFAIVLRRCPNSLGLIGGDENIGGDANPAAMIYELLTRPKGQNGLGIPAGFIDVDTYRAVGAVLADEELGFSGMQDRGTPAGELILEVLRHIDAIVYVEPSTGLHTITLVRFDYDVETLPVLDEDNCTVTAFSRTSWGEIKSQVNLTYVDRADGFIEKVVQAQDLAAIEAQGGEVSSQDLMFRGFSNATIASLWAARSLVAVAYPLAALTIEAHRLAWAFRPGMVFRLNWPKLGISGMVCRVLRLGTGDLQSGSVLIEAFEDVFAVEWTAYTPPGESGWVDPAGEVPALTDQDAFLAPYEAVRFLESPAPAVQRAVVVAARGTPGISKGFIPLIDGTGTRIPYFTPSGTLESGFTELSSTIAVDVGPDYDLVDSVNTPDFAQGVNVAWIADGTDPNNTDLEEFIAFKVVSVLGDVMTLSVLARGCLDTAPTSCAADKRIWFMSYGNAVVNATSGSTGIKVQPYNNQGVLPIGECVTSTVTGISPRRPSRIYCPTDVKFNGQSYPASISGELTVSWEHRDRLGEWSYADSGETASPEPGTEYDVLVYGENHTLVHTEVGLTGKSWTYLEADEIAESGLGRLNNHLHVIIKTYGDSRAHVAFREIEWEFDRV